MTFLPDSSYKHYRLGFFAACSSFIIWGTLPLYWYFLSHVEAGEILSHRIAWSFVFMLFVLIFAGRKQLKEDLAFLREKTSRIFLAGTHDLARRALPLAGFTLGRDLRSLRSRQKNAPSTADFEHHTGNTYRLGPVNHIYLQPSFEFIRPFFNE